jgi:hypothetical protein
MSDVKVRSTKRDVSGDRLMRILISVLLFFAAVTGLLTGRACSDPMTVNHTWLPIHEQHHQIVAVGPYRLTEPIRLPPELTPFSSALVTLEQTPKNKFWQLWICFPVTEERAVYQWAKSSPILVPKPSLFQWHGKLRRLTDAGMFGKGTDISDPPTFEASDKWGIHGVAETEDVVYGVLWVGQPKASFADPKTDPEVYEGTSPIKDKPRIVAAVITMTVRKHQPQPPSLAPTGKH